MLSAHTEGPQDRVRRGDPSRAVSRAADQTAAEVYAALNVDTCPFIGNIHYLLSVSDSLAFFYKTFFFCALLPFYFFIEKTSQKTSH